MSPLLSSINDPPCTLPVLSFRLVCGRIEEGGIILMKYLFVCAIVLAVCLSVRGSLTNTTQFYKDKTGTDLYYQSYTGYEDVDWYFPKGTASIYYSLWQGFNLPWTDKSIPLIIWLQGGPGAPSQFGCFNEIGPLYIQGKKGSQKPIENPWSWNSFGHVMCIDQPVGVGFSYNNNSKKVNNTRDATSHFVNFLSNFLKASPLSLANNPIYIAGESYAGHYIPSIADRILKNNSLGIKLKGIMIGDGYVDPINQINNYDSFLNSVGAVSNEWRDTTSFMQNEAIARIMRGELKEASGYTNFIIANDDVAAKYYLGMNVLNYKQYNDGNINPDYAAFLTENKKALGVPDWMNYVDDNQQMYEDFAEDISISFKRELENVLNLGLQTMIYNGQNDFIVNTAGVLTYLNTLEWQFAKQWKSTTKKIWSEYGGEHLGWSKNYRNLAFVQVRNAGHLLPSDQPRAAWAMLDNFFLNNW